MKTTTARAWRQAKEYGILNPNGYRKAKELVPRRTFLAMRLSTFLFGAAIGMWIVALCLEPGLWAALGLVATIAASVLLYFLQAATIGKLDLLHRLQKLMEDLESRMGVFREHFQCMTDDIRGLSAEIEAWHEEKFGPPNSEEEDGEINGEL